VARANTESFDVLISVANKRDACADNARPCRERAEVRYSAQRQCCSMNSFDWRCAAAILRSASSATSGVVGGDACMNSAV